MFFQYFFIERLDMTRFKYHIYNFLALHKSFDVFVKFRNLCLPGDFDFKVFENQNHFNFSDLKSKSKSPVKMRILKSKSKS